MHLVPPNFPFQMKVTRVCLSLLSAFTVQHCHSKALNKWLEAGRSTDIDSVLRQDVQWPSHALYLKRSAWWSVATGLRFVLVTGYIEQSKQHVKRLARNLTLSDSVDLCFGVEREKERRVGFTRPT